MTVIAQELIDSVINDIVDMKGTESMKDQYVKPYTYYTPERDFYKANTIVFGPDGEKVIMKGDDSNWSPQLELENRLRVEIKDKIQFRQNTIHVRWIQAIKDYQLCTIDRAIINKMKKQEWKTNEKQPIIRTFTDRVVSGLFTGDYSIKVYSATEQNQKKAQKVQKFTERAFSSSGTRKTIIDAGVDAVLLGNGFIRSGFKPSKQYIQSIKDPKKKKAWSIDAVYAECNYVSPFNIYYEPFRDFYKQPIIYRDFFDIRDIIKQKKDYFQLSKQQTAIILRAPRPFSQVNFNKVKMIKYYEPYILSTCGTTNEVTEQSIYQVKSDNNLCEYVEWIDGENLVIAINGYIVYDYINPSPTKTHPYKIISYTRTPGVFVGDGVGLILASSQKQFDSMHNMMFDLAKFNAGPMFLLKPGVTIEGNDKFLDREAFSFKKMSTTSEGGFEVFPMPKADQIPFKVMSDILELANQTIPNVNYNQLSGVSRSATDADYRFEALKDALRPLAESINEAFAMMVDERLLLAQKNMPSKFKVSVVGKDGLQIFEEISKSDLRGNFVFETEFESLKDINRASQRSQIKDLLEVIQVLGIDPSTQEDLVDRRKFLDYTLDLWTKNENFALPRETFYKMLGDAQKSQLQLKANLEKEKQVLVEEQTKVDESGVNPGSQYKEVREPLDIDAILAKVDLFNTQNTNEGTTNPTT